MKGSEIRARRERLLVSQEMLADCAVTNQQTIQRIETDATKHSRAYQSVVAALDRLEMIKARFPHLSGIELVLATAEDRLSKADAAKFSIEKDELYQTNEQLNQVPMFLTSVGPNGDLELSSKAIRPLIPRDHPFSLDGTYAIYLASSQFDPVFTMGDFLLVNSQVPPIEGTTCILFGGNSEKPSIKIGGLAAYDDDTWTLYVVRRDIKSTYQGEALTLDRRDWPRCERVLGRLIRL